MSRHRGHGFTLIELIIFIVVVSAGLAGILSVMNTTVSASADPVVRKQAIAIAESLLEEILLKGYCDPDTADTSTSPPTCGAYTVEASRSLYDDVQDYVGYTTTGIQDPQGAAVPGLGNYNIAPAVTVTADTLGVLPVWVVRVSVTGPQNTVVSLTGYRGNY